MGDKDGKIGDKKIKGVQSTTASKSVERPEAVGGVTSIRPTQNVGGVSGVGGIGKRRATREMTLAEREELFKMISEESEKLFGAAGISQEKKKVFENAVKIAVDAGLLPAGDDDNDGSSKKKV